MKTQIAFLVISRLNNMNIEMTTDWLTDYRTSSISRDSSKQEKIMLFLYTYYLSISLSVYLSCLLSSITFSIVINEEYGIPTVLKQTEGRQSCFHSHTLIYNQNKYVQCSSFFRFVSHLHWRLDIQLRSNMHVDWTYVDVFPKNQIVSCSVQHLFLCKIKYSFRWNEHSLRCVYCNVIHIGMYI